jgi:hypothetical protein
MKPSFAFLRMGYPKSEKREPLFESLGWSDIAQNQAYKDTCAIRMSIALTRAGVPLMTGTLKVHAGPLKGKRIEPRQRALSEMLKRMWGAPEVYKTEKDATEAIGTRSGVISFFRIGGGPGGHIDLIYPGPFGFSECARSCYFGCWEIWFWPLV